MLAVPGLHAILQEHLDDNGELLSHLLMADVTRWIMRRYQADPEDATVRQVLAFLESAFEETTGRDRGT